MLSGNNSILSQAGRARDITGEKSIAEKVQLAYLAALTTGNGEATEPNLVSELTKEFGEHYKGLKKDQSNKPVGATIDEKDYNFDGTVTPGEGGGGGTGLVEQEDGTFKDSKGNEWVWIEVPKTVTQSATTDSEIYNALRGYCESVITTVTSGSDYKATTCGWIDEWYAWDTTKNEAITEETENLTDTQKALTNGCGLSLSEYNSTKHAMLNSIKDNGGFYIGKYETGIENSYRTYAQGESYFNNNIEYPATEQAVIKQNAYPYNYVTCSQAQNLAKGFATDGKTASLLFGIQWDLVVKFLSVKGVETNLLNDNSTTWGNYSNNNSTNGTFNITSEHAMASSDYGDSYSAITKGTEKSGTKLLTTGSSTGLAKQGIYDLAGNVYEWTLEKTSYSNTPCAYRGGDYDASGDYGPASSRYDNSPTGSGNGVGFRVALY